MTTKLWMAVVAVCCLMVVSVTRAAALLQPETLRCESLVDPLGIDVPRPRLSWGLLATAEKERGLSQQAYQVLVAPTVPDLNAGTALTWDSGKIESSATANVRYAGPALVSGQPCFWKVRVWDGRGEASAWSKPARWSMGLLAPEDWKAQWIGHDETQDAPERRLPARTLRKEFAVDKALTRATVYMSGLGWSELYLNGKKVSSDVLAPGLTDYQKRVFYQTYDVSAAMRSGANVVGVVLGNGRYYAPRLKVPAPTQTYGYPKLRLQLQLDFADGTSTQVLSDGTWKLTTNGPIVANNEYDGEEYDARLELGRWAYPGFDDAAWPAAQVVAAPAGRLVAPLIDPSTVTATIDPIAVKEVQPGTFIFDLGQNFAGWCRLHVAGPRSTRITLRHAERLNADGTLYVANLRGAKATDIYTLKGGGDEAWEPRFTLHGFRYVEMTGYPGTATAGMLEGRVVNDDLESAGEFECSNRRLNQIYHNIVWGMRSNYRSIVTDCCQRDERQGWLGDRNEESRAESYMFRHGPLYAKWVRDMADSQRANGSVSDVCPNYWQFYHDGVTWPSSLVIIPGMLVDQYADTDTLAQVYPNMVKWIDHMCGYLKDDIMPRDNYGDWCMPPEDPKAIHSKDPARKTAGPLIATSYFYGCLRAMVRYATLLHQPADAARFDALAQRLKKALNEKFYKPELGQYDNGTATSCVLPLAFDMVPADQQARVVGHLVDKIMKENHGHISTGLIGCQWINRVLARHGQGTVAYTMATQATYPSLGYMVEQGATTIWELWNGDTANPAMNSGNHVMLVGDLPTFLFEDVAGIRPDPDQPGFSHIIMRPTLVGDLTFVRATHRGPTGLIASVWKNDRDGFQWDVTVPPNTTATLAVPAKDVASVTESGVAAAQAPGLKAGGAEEGRVVFTAGSGTYHFVSH